MAKANSIELAAEIVAAFISNNPLPKSELSSLIQAVHESVMRLAAEPENTQPQIEVKEPAVPIRKSVMPEFLICLDDGTIQVSTASSGRARPNAGAIPREMEVALRLSHGCAKLRSTAVRIGETDWTWSDSAGSRCPSECRPVEGD